MSNAKMIRIEESLGFAVGAIPFNYLGCPIFVGKPRIRHVQAIIDIVKLKLAAWKGILLSIMG